MKTYKSCSDARPEDWDLTSSSTTVYHNYNVAEIPAAEDAPTMYEYDVDQYTKQEYLLARQEQIESENLTAMKAVAELFEMFMGGDL